MNVDWVYDVVKDPEYMLRWIDTTKMIADMFTKPFPNKKKGNWDNLCRLAGLGEIKNEDNNETAQPAAILRSGRAAVCTSPPPPW